MEGDLGAWFLVTNSAAPLKSTASVEWLLCPASDSVNSDLKLSVFFSKQSWKPAENRRFFRLRSNATIPLMASGSPKIRESGVESPDKTPSNRLKSPDRVPGRVGNRDSARMRDSMPR
ncbi:MAG: hypothetical protein EON59_13115 [Alphaproteobacteria bacterium]|nr:MAG: hypothetical protein EON59_13115 [Alphaproteobacteria bacterium]